LFVLAISTNRSMRADEFYDAVLPGYFILEPVATLVSLRSRRCFLAVSRARRM
jgi:hypothetical protein